MIGFLGRLEKIGDGLDWKDWGKKELLVTLRVKS